MIATQAVACVTRQMFLAGNVTVMAVLVGLAGFSGCVATRNADREPDTRRLEYKARRMGVIARIVMYASDTSAASTAADAAFARIASLDAVFSSYRADSEVARLQNVDVGIETRVSVELFHVLSRAAALWESSSGAFDPTVGPLAEVWRTARMQRRLPDDRDVAAAMRRTGWQHVRLDPVRRTVSFALPGMALDLGALAKGYAADEAIAVLRQHGFGQTLVELGGDIVVGDPPPGADGWIIDGSNYGAIDSLVVENAAVSTSGDVEQHVEIDGTRYSHVIDPRTGIGLTSGIVVTAVAPSGLTADGLSTTVGVVGEEAGLALARRLFPEARIYVRPRPEMGESPN